MSRPDGTAAITCVFAGTVLATIALVARPTVTSGARTDPTRLLGAIIGMSAKKKLSRRAVQ